MIKPTLPPRPAMVAAFLERDASFDGVFYTAVRTTGIFCRPTCSARKPKPENVEFFATARDALFSGYRPCKRCRPLEAGGTPPGWLRELLAEIENEPTRRWTDGDLRERGLHPDRVRRWFQKEHGMTFHAYARARRLGLAMAEINEGAPVAPAAFGHGYESLSGFNEAFKHLLGEAPRDARSKTVVQVTRVATPLGPMVAAATDGALCLLEFADRRMLEKQLRRLRSRLNAALVPGTNDVLDRIGTQLDQYFRGERQAFDVEVRAPGTPFQERVWAALRDIPYGATISYADLASAIGQPSAVRAVARANGDNRIAVVIPCHRVIGKDGTLTGYGGGLWRKRRLLEVEGCQVPL